MRVNLEPMTVLNSFNEITWMGYPVGRGTLVQDTKTGDIADVQWVSTHPFWRDSRYAARTMASIQHDPFPAHDCEWEDLVFKVNVWRLGEPRMWRGAQVKLVLDPETGEPPARVEL